MSSEAFPWVDVIVEGKPKKRCTDHGQTFDKKSVCSECRKGLRKELPRQPKEPLPEPPAGCMSTVQIERWFVDLAKASAARAAAIEDVVPIKLPAKPSKKKRGKANAKSEGNRFRDFHDETAIANHRDRAIKAMRAACELAARREDDAIVDARDERLSAQQRGAAN